MVDGGEGEAVAAVACTREVADGIAGSRLVDRLLAAALRDSTDIGDEFFSVAARSLRVARNDPLLVGTPRADEELPALPVRGWYAITPAEERNRRGRAERRGKGVDSGTDCE